LMRIESSAGSRGTFPEQISALITRTFCYVPRT
jgi:hypothetical protein